MQPNEEFAKLASAKEIETVIKALKGGNINAFEVDTVEEAKEEVIAIIPKGAEVFTMTSMTLEAIGVAKEINESGNYNSVRNEFNSMDRKTQKREMSRIGAAPEYAIGSVHAVTQDGKVLIASNTGSQLAGYVYGAEHVIWVVGAQKIVKDFDEGLKRVYEYSLPLESERARRAYGTSGSAVNKLLVINKEVVPNRITMVIVRQKLGF